MMHINKFEKFLYEKMLTDEELEAQTEPTHIVKKKTDFRSFGGDAGFDLYPLDFVYIDEEGERMLVIDGRNPGMILDIFPGFTEEEYFIRLDSPEGKQYLKDHRGKMKGKKFGF